MECNHRSGDLIQGTWVCAHCYRILPERPVKYAIRMRSNGPGPRQEVVWIAPVAKDADGTTLSKFVAWMVGHLRRKSLWSISKHEALQQCLEALRDMGEPFGDDGFTWDKDDAKEIVNESIIAYWDEGPSGANT